MTWAWGLSEKRPLWQYVVPPLLLIAGFGLVAVPGISDVLRGVGALIVLVAILSWAWKTDGPARAP